MAILNKQAKSLKIAEAKTHVVLNKTGQCPKTVEANFSNEENRGKLFNRMVL
jgi:hypothetical protein